MDIKLHCLICNNNYLMNLNNMKILYNLLDPNDEDYEEGDIIPEKDVEEYDDDDYDY